MIVLAHIIVEKKRLQDLPDVEAHRFLATSDDFRVSDDCTAAVQDRRYSMTKVRTSIQTQF